MTTSKLSQGEAAGLLTRYHTALYAYIFACIRSHHDTEDIMQNVAVVVVESLNDLKDEAGFLPWAREIARRCSLAHCRKKRREQAFDPELMQSLADAADILERTTATSVHGDALMACLERLPPKSRRLLTLRYAGAFIDTEDLARQIGRSVQAVYAQVKRIKLALRHCAKRRLTEAQA
jgi:RNA polymerase sigma-70 factor